MVSIRNFAAALVVAALASAPAWAAPEDYKFELVGPPAKSGKETVLKVRLVHVPDNKAVADAIIIQTRLDMAPGGMAEMAAPVQPMPAGEAGVYQFRAEPSVAGDWALHLSAKVQGEAGTVRGTVPFKAQK
jgi:hypothetical protein